MRDSVVLSVYVPLLSKSFLRSDIMIETAMDYIRENHPSILIYSPCSTDNSYMGVYRLFLFESFTIDSY
jgi:hypothetical protein